MRLCSIDVPQILSFATRKGLVNLGCIKRPEPVATNSTDSSIVHSGMLPPIYSKQKVGHIEKLRHFFNVYILKIFVIKGCSTTNYLMITRCWVRILCFLSISLLSFLSVSKSYRYKIDKKQPYHIVRIHLENTFK